MYDVEEHVVIESK
jgi:carbonic anhydrase